MFVTENMKKMSKNGVKMMKIDIVNFLQKIQNAKEKQVDIERVSFHNALENHPLDS